MSYSTLKDYALSSYENLYSAFAAGLLSSEEAKSDVIWVENKELIFKIIQEGWFIILEEEVGTDFWKNWASQNFTDIVRIWEKSSNARSLLTHSYSPLSTNICEIAKAEPDLKDVLKNVLKTSLEISAICYDKAIKLRIWSELFELDSKFAYKHLVAKKNAVEDLTLLISEGESFFKFEEYCHNAQSLEQRKDAIYLLVMQVLGQKVPKSGVAEKNSVIFLPEESAANQAKLETLERWIAKTGLTADIELFEEVKQSFFFGYRGVTRDTVSLSFDWFADNSQKITAMLSLSSVQDLFAQIIQNNLTPVDEIIDNFSKVTGFRTAPRKELVKIIVQHKFATFAQEGIEKLKAIAHVLDKLDGWTNVKDLIDFSKISFEEFCGWAAARYKSPEKFTHMSEELGCMKANFDVSIEQLKEILLFLKNAPKADQIINTTLATTCLKVEHPFVKQKDWLSANILDLNSPTALNPYKSWSAAREWIRTEVNSASTFFSQVFAAFNSFNLKDPLQVLQKEVFNAYIGYAFYMEPNKMIEEGVDALKRNKFSIRNSFVAKALEIAKSVKGGFDAKKHLPTAFAMTYFASKRKGKNLFDKYRANIAYDATTSLYYNQTGILGLELADPFEKGFSWGNYEKIAKMCRVTDYAMGSSQEVRSKRMAVFLFNYFVEGDPDAINAKLAQTEAKSISRVVAKIARLIPTGSPNLHFILNKFHVLRERRAEIIEYFADKHHHLGALVDVARMLIETGKFMSPSLLPYAEMFSTFSSMDLKEEDIQKYQTYMVMALKNKVSMSSAMRAIKHASNFSASCGEVPAKNIKAEPVVLTEQGVKARILDNGDLRALTIGLEISCCQYLDGYASTCAVATYENPNYGIVLVDNIDQSKGTRPLAEAAVWISGGMVVIDSIEGLRKDAAGYSKIAAAFDQLIKQWHAQGLRVGISTTDYGMTVQIYNKLRREFGYFTHSANTPARPLPGVYSDVGSYLNELKKS